MQNFDLLALMLLSAFTLHDLEEIALFRRFLDKSGTKIALRFPIVSVIFTKANTISTTAFTFVVAEEFLLLSVISFLAGYYDYYGIWIAAFMAFFLHLLIHICQWIMFSCYVPGLITALLFIPACMYIFNQILAANLYTYPEIATLAAVGFALMVLNLFVMHYLAAKLKI